MPEVKSLCEKEKVWIGQEVCLVKFVVGLESIHFHFSTFSLFPHILRQMTEMALELCHEQKIKLKMQCNV